MTCHVDNNDVNGKVEDINGFKDVTALIEEFNGTNHEVNGHVLETNHIKEIANAPCAERTGNEMTLAVGGLEDAVIILITDKNESDELVFAILSLLELRIGSKASISPLSSLEVSSTARYICLAELDAPVLHNTSAGTFECVQKLLLTCSSILWVNSGAYRFAENPENNITQGLLRTIRSELGKPAALLDLDPKSRLKASDCAELILQALKTSVVTPEDGSPVDYEFAEENGQLVVPRAVAQEDMNLTIFRETQSSAPYLQDFEQPGRRVKVAVGIFGALESLYWKDEIELPLADDEIEIKLACTGMNFKDIVIAMGQVASPYLGVEGSGTIARIGRKVSSLKVGDRVCAMPVGGYSTYTRCAATSAAIIPEDMTFEIAAAIPVIYSTAYYSIVELAGLEAGEKVLIHAASGGVGQAAIQLSQMIGAEIYTIVGSTEKKELLIDIYGLPENRIFYSRDTTFGPAVSEAIRGEGVDVVINSLAGNLLRESWECLAPFGRFVEIGKRDITSNTRLEMAKFDKNCSFSSVDLTLIAAKRPKTMGKLISAVIKLITKKTIVPITPITVVGMSEIEMTLRKLQSGKTSGKVVVSHLGNQQVKVKQTTRSRSSVVANSDN
jgi:NADPH:quinone reductase-like Zn-dependent oxidoreductase